MNKIEKLIDRQVKLRDEALISLTEYRDENLKLKEKIKTLKKKLKDERAKKRKPNKTK